MSNLTKDFLLDLVSAATTSRSAAASVASA